MTDQKPKTKKAWKHLTDADLQEIVALYKTGKYTQDQIARKVKRGSGTISSILKKYKQEKLFGVTPKKVVQETLIKKPVSPPELDLTPKQMTLDPDEIKLLKGSESSNEFIKEYFMQFGFDRRTANQLRDFWTKRAAIFTYDQIQYAMHKLNQVKPKITKVTTKADEEIGSTPSLETLVTHTNQYLAECIQLHKEMLDISKKQLKFFEQERERVISEKALKQGKTE